MEISVRKAVFEDAAALAPRLRAADRDEILASWFEDPAHALALSIEKSDVAFAVVIDGQVEMLFGVATINVLSRTGCPWALASDVATSCRLFLRRSRPTLTLLSRGFSRLTNIVDERNTLSIRWLKWLGFRFSEPFVFGPNDERFLCFEMRL